VRGGIADVTLGMAAPVSPTAPKTLTNFTLTFSRSVGQKYSDSVGILFR